MKHSNESSVATDFELPVIHVGPLSPSRLLITTDLTYLCQILILLLYAKTPQTTIYSIDLLVTDINPFIICRNTPNLLHRPTCDGY